MSGKQEEGAETSRSREDNEKIETTRKLSDETWDSQANESHVKSSCGRAQRAVSPEAGI